MTEEKTEVVVENPDVVETKVVAPVAPAAPAPPVAEAKSAEDPATEILRNQLNDARRATDAANVARASAERARAEQAQKALEAEAQATAERQNAVLGSLEGAMAERDSAKSAWETAMAAGDYKKASEEQEKLTKAVYKIADLEGKKGAFPAAPKPTEGRVVAPQPPQPSDPIESYLAQFTPRTQSYMRQRPDLITNKKMNFRALAAHEDAVEKGLRPDTDEYFLFLDDELGYGDKPISKPAVVPAPAPGQRKSASIAAAPPSRGTITPNGAGKVKVTLTDAQKRAARIAGVTEQAYAEQLVIAERNGAFLTKAG